MMLKVKNCPRITLPTPDPSLPPPPPLIPSSIVTIKSVPSAPPPVPISMLIKKIVPSDPPPSKKLCPHPFIRGQVGHKFFSLSQPRSYTKIPDGCSLIIVGFRKPLPHENVKSSFVFLDPYGGTWMSPQVFNVWREEVESGALTSDEFATHRVALVRNGVEFFLAFSDRKTQINNVTNQIQQDPKSDDEAFPNADSEDEREKHDPDFFPDNED